MKPILFLPLFLLIFIGIPCTAEPTIEISDQEMTPLTGQWLYTYGNETPDESGLTTSLPAELNSGDRAYPVLKLETVFRVPADLANERLYLILGKRWGPIQAFINGVEVVKRGEFFPDYHYHEAHRVNAPIPEGLIRHGGNNTLTIRFGHERDRPTIEPPAIGFIEDYRYHEYLVNFLNVDLYRYLSFLSLFVSFFYLMQFAVRPKERESLVFALVNLGLAVYFLRLGYPFNLFPVSLSYAVSKAVFFPSITLMTSFLASYMNSRSLKRIMPFFWICSILTAVAMLIFHQTSLQNDRIFSVALIPVALELTAMLTVSVKAQRRGNPDALPVLIGLSVGTIFAAHDIIYMVLRIYPDWWIQGLAAFCFTMGVFASLAIRSMRLHDELERYSEMIEQKVTDRTRELRRANSDLQSAMQSARHASQAKSRFLANISHEMRTPLNCIIGFSEMSIRNASEEQRKNLDVVLEESERLLTLINQLLDIEKIEAGKISLNNEIFNLKELLNQVGKSFILQCEEKGLKLEIEVGEEVPDLIEGDPFRLRQVLDNLVSNAVKFTKQGKILIRAAGTSGLGGKPQLRFSVIDTGIGIGPEQAAKVFESFEQGDSSRNRLYGGTGLGTTIAKQLVNLMHGEIDFTSSPGTGTEFWFTIPRRVPEEQIPAFNSHSADSSRNTIRGNPRVLVVEDYAPNRIIARSHLESAGCRVSESEGGREAVALVSAEEYDLILMDIQMPDMDGIEATRFIREDLARDTIPILGLTANAYPEDLEAYRRAGMNGVLTKPIRRDPFLASIASVLNGEEHPEDYSNAAETSEGDGVCDFRALEEELGGNRSAAEKMLKEFAAELLAQLPRIDTALIHKDWELLHRELHSLKGGALNLFAPSLARAAALAEGAAKNRNEAALKELLPQLNERSRELIDLITSRA